MKTNHFFTLTLLSSLLFVSCKPNNNSKIDDGIYLLGSSIEKIYNIPSIEMDANIVLFQDEPECFSVPVFTNWWVRNYEISIIDIKGSEGIEYCDFYLNYNYEGDSIGIIDVHDFIEDSQRDNSNKTSNTSESGTHFDKFSVKEVDVYVKAKSFASLPYEIKITEISLNVKGQIYKQEIEVTILNGYKLNYSKELSLGFKNQNLFTYKSLYSFFNREAPDSLYAEWEFQTDQPFTIKSYYFLKNNYFKINKVEWNVYSAFGYTPSSQSISSTTSYCGNPIDASLSHDGDLMDILSVSYNFDRLEENQNVYYYNDLLLIEISKVKDSGEEEIVILPNKISMGCINNNQDNYVMDIFQTYIKNDFVEFNEHYHITK